MNNRPTLHPHPIKSHIVTFCIHSSVFSVLYPIFLFFVSPFENADDWQFAFRCHRTEISHLLNTRSPVHLDLIPHCLFRNPTVNGFQLSKHPYGDDDDDNIDGWMVMKMMFQTIQNNHVLKCAPRKVCPDSLVSKKNDSSKRNGIKIDYVFLPRNKRITKA